MEKTNFNDTAQTFPTPGSGDARMALMTTDSGYSTPKLEGLRVPFKGRLQPHQHKAVFLAALQHGMSMSNYMGALIDRDAGSPNMIDNPPVDQELPLTG